MERAFGIGPEFQHAARDMDRARDLAAVGNLGRVACEMIGTLTAANTVLECLDLSNTGLGLAIGSEGEGGHILLRPMCESKLCPLKEINLTNIQLSDKAGVKLLSILFFFAGLMYTMIGAQYDCGPLNAFLRTAAQDLTDADRALLPAALLRKRKQNLT